MTNVILHYTGKDQPNSLYSMAMIDFSWSFGTLLTTKLNLSILNQEWLRQLSIEGQTLIMVTIHTFNVDNDI